MDLSTLCSNVGIALRRRHRKGAFRDQIESASSPLPAIAMNAYALLACAIALEVAATSLLKASDGMTRLWPTLGALFGYGVCFWLLSMVMKTVPTGIAYAIWSGVGIVLISLIGLFVFKQKLDLPALIGIGLICAGVVVINVFSHSTAH